MGWLFNPLLILILPREKEEKEEGEEEGGEGEEGEGVGEGGEEEEEEEEEEGAEEEGGGEVEAKRGLQRNEKGKGDSLTCVACIMPNPI